MPSAPPVWRMAVVEEDVSRSAAASEASTRGTRRLSLGPVDPRRVEQNALRDAVPGANGVGVIDPDYCGPEDEVKIAVMNFTREPVTVRAGDRIAQGLSLIHI